MKAWLVRHRWAFPVIAVTLALIGATVVYPAWWRNIGYLEAAHAVSVGEPIEIDGVQWRLDPIAPPAAVDEETTPNTRPVLFVLRHELAGATSSVADTYSKCAMSFLDGQGRRWLSKPLPFDAFSWLQSEGLTADCRKPLPLVAYAQVPKDVHITTVELLLSRLADPNLRVMPDASELTTVIRFDTG